MRDRVTRAGCVLACLFAVAGCSPPATWSWHSGAAALIPPAAAQAAPQVVKTPVRVVAVGDLMLGTPVKQLILSRGADYPYRKYRRLLQDADLTFGNLETPLSDRGTPTPGKSPESLRAGTNYLFRAPPVAAQGLAAAGFDVVSIANNHTMDYGGVALLDTLEHCEEAGVIPVGAGRDIEAAMKPVLLRRNGQKIALFAISDILPAMSVASRTSPGVAPARGAWFNRHMPAALARARKEADWVLVSVHWGRERYTGATERQKQLGRRLIDWGADVIIGAHTHRMGPIERYHGGWIHYSLGNFVGYPGSRANVEAWEVVLPAGRAAGAPTQQSYAFDWTGDRLARR